MSMFAVVLAATAAVAVLGTGVGVFLGLRATVRRLRADALAARALRWQVYREARVRHERNLFELMRARLWEAQLRAELDREAHVRRRHRICEKLHADMVGSINVLALRLQPVPDDSPAAEVRNSALILASQEEAIAALSTSMQKMWPTTPMIRDGNSQNMATHLKSILQVLERNSLKMAATEQVFLNLLSPAQPDAGAVAVALQHVGGTLPDALHGAGNAFWSYAQSPEFVHSVGNAAVDVMTGLVPHLIKRIPTILETAHTPGLVITESVATSAPELRGIFGHMALDAAGSTQFVDAAHHVAPLIGAFEHLAVVEGIAVHVPFITIFVSMSRELSLLADGSTNVERSIKNFTLDVTGTAVGAATGYTIGHIVGGIIGTAAGPGHGTLLGAAAGAVLFRSLTNKIKRQAFDKANERYKAIVTAAPDRLTARHIDFCLAASDRVMQAGDTLRHRVGQGPALNAWRESEWRVIAVAFRNAARQDLDAALCAVEIAGDWAVSDSQLAANLAAVRPALEQAQRTLRKAEERIGAKDYGTGVAMVAVWPMQPPEEFCAVAGDALIDLTNRRTMQAGKWSQMAAAEYLKQTRMLSEALTREYHAYRRDHQAIVDEVKEAEEAVLAERRALGIKD